MKHHLNENSTRPVWTRVSTRLHQQRQSWSPLSAAVLALATWLYSVNLATASIIVDNPGDSHVVGKISLREAIQRASAIDDVITFAPGITLVTLSAGELGIARGVTISG